MTSTQTNGFNLVLPTSPSLNVSARSVGADEIGSVVVQDIIRYMLNLSAGKGLDKDDSRQMVGLAAPQLGVNRRIITIDLTADGSNKAQTLQVFINPKITRLSKEHVLGREGCWSCGNICGSVRRAKDVTIVGTDSSGKSIRFELTGFVARIAQHETDHLDGIRFPDRVPLDEPEHLHLVEPREFDDYRSNWMHWSKLCPREQWNMVKIGSEE